MFPVRSLIKLVLLVPLGMLCVSGACPKPAPAERVPGVQEGPPVAEHERLMKLAGKYTTTIKMTGAMTAPETTGEATFTPILGGRFLQQEDKWPMMGQTFEARKTYGYNTGSKKYEGLWTYTGSTAMMMLSGTSADSGKTVTFDASYEGASGKVTPFEIVMTELGPDKFSIALKSKPGAGGDKPTSMETTYTRKK